MRGGNVMQNDRNDLISRKAAIDAIRASTSKYTGFMEMEMYTDDDAVEAIEALPSAQPEIIRCRECRHWYTGDGYNHENGAQCALTHMWMSPDDYCSYGRRKVSETDG